MELFEFLVAAPTFMKAILLLISLAEDAGCLRGVMKQMLRVILSERRNRQTFLLSF
jgi:hypothetical protein